MSELNPAETFLQMQPARRWPSISFDRLIKVGCKLRRLMDLLGYRAHSRMTSHPRALHLEPPGFFLFYFRQSREQSGSNAAVVSLHLLNGMYWGFFSFWDV